MKNPNEWLQAQLQELKMRFQELTVQYKNILKNKQFLFDTPQTETNTEPYSADKLRSILGDLDKQKKIWGQKVVNQKWVVAKGDYSPIVSVITKTQLEEFYKYTQTSQQWIYFCGKLLDILNNNTPLRFLDVRYKM